MIRSQIEQALSPSEKLVIKNPKRGAAAQLGRDRWFPYYAGFSTEFANSIISSTALSKGATLMDPWNGSGTTTYSAVFNGFKAVGFDLNPAMAVVAKARLVPQPELASVSALLVDILKRAALTKNLTLERDPLNVWLGSEAVGSIRRIDRAIYRILVRACAAEPALDGVARMPCLAAFFYVALFRTVHLLLDRFKPSNPTWVSRPATARGRIRPPADRVRGLFSEQVKEMINDAICPTEAVPPASSVFSIAVASSQKLPIDSASIDLVVSSPPYCTRIDYGVATSPELAVLGFDIESGLRELRTELIGTPTVHRETPDPQESWGSTCVRLLAQIWKHKSKAARSYYYKTYAQYFAAMAQSLSELGRCVRPNGHCVLVVQDSYFKDKHIDLARIIGEMAGTASLQLERRVDFPTTRTFGSVNAGSRSYRSASSVTESVLCFVRRV